MPFLGVPEHKKLDSDYKILPTNPALSAKAPTGFRASPQTASASPFQIFRKDLMGVGLLGVGEFGAVELVAHRRADETFAMKSGLSSSL